MWLFSWDLFSLFNSNLVFLTILWRLQNLREPCALAFMFFFVTILAGHLSYFSWENVFWIYTIFYRDSHLTIKKIAVCPPPLGAISGYFGGIWGFVPIFRGYFSMAWATQHFIMIFSTKLSGINLYFLNISISVDIYLSKSTYLGSAHT